MLMIISIVVVLTMVSLCAYLAVLSKDQLVTKDSAIENSRIDASSAAIAHIMENQIKEDLIEMYPTINDPNPPLNPEDIYKPNTFLSNYKNSWIDMSKKMSVSKIESIDIKYNNNTSIRKVGNEVRTYGCFVITVKYSSVTYNYAFFAEEFDRNGYEKGDFISEWIN